MIHARTKNKSFLKMHYILKGMGIKNNMFFLQLYDETLADIDPLDEDNLTDEQKLRVHIEISRNPWYYFREIIKIPMTDVKLDFELTRATLAILWSLINDLHSYVVIPRQCYKSYTVACFYSWLIYWGAKNFSAAFFAQNDGLVTQNLTRVKDIRESLPKYLNLKSNVDTDNQHMIVYRAGEYTNTVITRAPGMNEDAANNVGRGNSTMGQWYDEFAFIPYIWVQYGAAIPAYSTVAKAAERNGSHHHIIITTTAGNKKTKTGGWAYDFLNSCAPFTELLYDMCDYDENGNPFKINKAEVMDYISNNNTGQAFLRIEYMWYELSKPMGYLDEMKALMPGLDEFARGVLNQWTDSNADHPLGQERVQALMETISDPTKIVMIDKVYVLKYYRDPEIARSQSHRIVFASDTSGNNRRDYSTLVGVDITNSEVVCTMRVNQYSVTRFAKAISYIMLYLFPRSKLIIERNYLGKMSAEIIAEMIGASRMYIDEKDGMLGVNMVHKLREVMYGDVLRVSVVELGKFIHDKTIIDEIAGLITDKNGRIDHKQNGGHDDTLIAYLYCRWFIMFCKSRTKYFDAVLFNANLEGTKSESELDSLSTYNSDSVVYNSFMTNDRTYGLDLKLSNERDNSNNYLVRSSREAIDNMLSHEQRAMHNSALSFNSAEDFITAYDDSPKISKDDIAFDTLAEGEEPHEYSENLDKDDTEKIAKETDEKRVETEPESIFNFSFIHKF